MTERAADAMSDLDQTSCSTERVSVGIVWVVSDAVMAPEMVARVVRFLDGQQLFVQSLSPIARCPVMHDTGALREIAVLANAIQSVHRLLGGQGTCIPHHHG